MLGRPAPRGARAVVVGPDDLVEEALASEDLVEQQLAVVRLAVVDVEVERALARQQPVRVLEARREEREVVVEAVAVGGARRAARCGSAGPESRVRSPSSSRTVRSVLRDLRPAGVERRIDVDQLERPVGEAGQQLEVVAEQDLIDRGASSVRRHGHEGTFEPRWTDTRPTPRRRHARSLQQAVQARATSDPCLLHGR